MKYTEIINRDKGELQKLLKEKKLHLFEIRLRLRTMQLKNTNELRAVRKEIARINTALVAKG